MGLENAYFFFRPVDPVADGAPEYFRVITEPMCFLTIQKKLDSEQYKTFEPFIRDMKLTLENAMLYNQPSHPISKTAGKIWSKLDLIVGSLPRAICESSRCSGLQRLVELRFARYNANKKTHQ
jgi:hypothetical protein